VLISTRDSRIKSSHYSPRSCATTVHSLGRILNDISLALACKARAYAYAEIEYVRIRTHSSKLEYVGYVRSSFVGVSRIQRVNIWRSYTGVRSLRVSDIGRCCPAIDIRLPSQT